MRMEWKALQKFEHRRIYETNLDVEMRIKFEMKTTSMPSCSIFAHHLAAAIERDRENEQARKSS